jgi:predicted DNA-binding protein (MmcQ/YjbR family)
MEEAEVLSRLREACLGLPEVRETIKWGHSSFEAGKKMFAVLDCYEGRPCIAFRASVECRLVLLADERFFEAPYAARHGWVCLRTDSRLSWREVETLVRESYRLVALKRMVAALDEQAPASGTVKQRRKRSRQMHIGADGKGRQKTGDRTNQHRTERSADRLRK